MIYNFCIWYFYDKTYRFAENREKLIFCALTSNNFFSIYENDGELLNIIHNYICLNNFTDFQLVGVLCTFECLN